MNDHDADLRATVMTSPTGGVSVTTTGVTQRPATFNLRIPQGRTWNTYVTWTHEGTPTTFGTAQFVARTVAGGTALIDLSVGAGITVGTNYATISLSAAQTAALAFVRARYNFNVTRGGTVTPLLEGSVDLDKSVMV